MTTETEPSKTNVVKLPMTLNTAARNADDSPANNTTPLARAKIDSVTLTMRSTWRALSDDKFGYAAISLTATVDGEEVSVTSHEVDDQRAWRRMKTLLNDEALEKFTRLLRTLR